jgi:hypothetical protein
MSSGAGSFLSQWVKNIEIMNIVVRKEEKCKNSCKKT